MLNGDRAHQIMELRPIGEVVVLLCVFIAGCVATHHVGEPGLPEKDGKASYYAGKYAGHPTASGEIFDPDAITAAHRTLPFGTRVRVTRTDGADGPSVVVRINDRGPFKDGRVIDLSKAAAQQLRMIGEGVVPVQLKVVSYPEGVETSSSEPSDAAW
jgi:rare lipoprotein A